MRGFEQYKYPNEIGPGVYDIHSPRVPSTAEITGALKSMTRVLDGAQIWVNPDCGLKTRGWEETLAALKNMVAAANEMRQTKDVKKETSKTSRQTETVERETS